GDPIIDGWLALAPVAARDVAELDEGLLRWRETYTNHPAARGLLAEMLARQRGSEAFPRRIALLLPLSSQAQPAALAIRDGFLAAHFMSANRQDVAVAVYDTALLGSQEAYLRAQLEGAEFIVGPLLRSEVEQIAPQVGFVPTLALNFLQGESPAARGFFQFALAPEDEARQAARHA